jgi:hypothetical protein
MDDIKHDGQGNIDMNDPGTKALMESELSSASSDVYSWYPSFRVREVAHNRNLCGLLLGAGGDHLGYLYMLEEAQTRKDASAERQRGTTGWSEERHSARSTLDVSRQSDVCSHM